MTENVAAGTVSGVAATPPPDGQVAGQGQESAAPTQPGAGDRAATLEAALAEQRKIQSGLDQRVAQLAKQLELATQDREKLDQELKTAREATATGATKLQEYEQRLPKLEADLGQFKAQLDARSAEAQRATLVATEFPALAPLLQVGGLPPFTDAEEYRGKLGTIMGAISASAQGQARAQMQGARPPASPPAAGTPPSRDDLYPKMMQAIVEGKPEAEALVKQWQEITGSG